MYNVWIKEAPLLHLGAADKQPHHDDETAPGRRRHDQTQGPIGRGLDIGVGRDATNVILLRSLLGRRLAEEEPDPTVRFVVATGILPEFAHPFAQFR